MPDALRPTDEMEAAPADAKVEVAAIILAAGKSTRMKSKLPKPLHPLCGLPMTAHVIRACREAGVSRIVVIIGHEGDRVRAGLGEGVEYAIQQTQRGTGDAALAAHALLTGWNGIILILAGDVPLLTGAALRRLIDAQRASGAAASLLTAHLDDATGYGRIVRDAEGGVARIVEQKDATPEERALTEWNPSLYAFEAASLWPALAQITPDNAQGEFYLTDTIGVLRRQNRRIEALPVSDARDVMGVNNRVELAGAAAILRQRILIGHMLNGVSVTDPATTYVETDVEIGQDTVLEPNTFLYGGTRIGEDCILGPFTRIARSSLGNGVKVLASQIVESELADGASVGPFANLRPGAKLGPGAKVGDFVEIKNATLGARAQASHLTYIGDADIGDETNIGAGTITCNYDGYQKHRTVIGKRAFIGSHSTLVAPLTLGDGAFTAAGSTVTADVPADALAIARSQTTIKEGWAARYRERKQAETQKS